MPEETVRQASMTTYEIIATILAVIALLQPWIITIWKKFFKPLKVTFIPSAKINSIIIAVGHTYISAV